MIGAMFTSVAKAADQAPPSWVVEPEVRAGADFTMGDARRIFHQALDLGVGAMVWRSGWGWRGRGALAIEPVIDVGPGASLAIFRARIGIERDWYSHLVTALDLGGSVRRLSTDEIARSVPGFEASANLGWRASVSARWSLTASLRFSATWFSRDEFIWQELGVSLALSRTSGALRSPAEVGVAEPAAYRMGYL
ncbi:MAG TPA: hypothetical protein VGL59_03760 [Polyangia bacterium]